MKNKYLIISLIIFFDLISLVKAQDTLLINPAKIDSLQQLIDSRPKADEEKVRLLNEYARLCFFNQEFQKGFIATRDARELSSKIDFKGGQIMYYITLAAISRQGQIHNYRLEQARRLVEESDNQLAEYFTELNVPIGYPQNNPEQILEKLIPLLQYFENLDDKEIQFTIIDEMGWSYYILGRTNETKIIAKKMIELSSDLSQLYLKFISYSRLIYLNILEGDTDESGKIEKKLIEMFAEAKDHIDSDYLNYLQANYFNNSGQYALAIDYYLKSADEFEEKGNLNRLIKIYNQLGYAYQQFEMHEKAVEIYEKYISIFKKLNDNIGLHNAYQRPVLSLFELKRYDEARHYMALALQGANEQDRPLLLALNNMLEGQILMDEGKYREAIAYLQKTYETYLSFEDSVQTAAYTISFTLLYIAECYQKLGDMNSALKYGLECLERENQLNHARTIIKVKISILIAEIYVEKGQSEKALDYIKMYQEIITESNKTENANKIAEAEIRSIIDKSEKQINLLEKEKTQKIQQSKIQRVWIFSITGALLSALLVSLILYRNNKSKQKANALLNQQKEEIQDSLIQLKATQSQLIQSEKMASLGELTAGIAHEIQNPLNFVNNFSEVNTELIDELSEEVNKGNLDEVKAIAKDIKANEEKINYHGKRADAIVKGMLQHSRTSSGEKELTDINLLCDEYLRLAYHGLRAKDSNFQSAFVTEFDPTLAKINIIPQDMGRVLLNLINNAFQAIDERSKKSKKGYQPKVTIKTKQLDGKIEITVNDNGNGIPDSIKDKIFQPFFTTKPTGQGTGLGLSLSYDIIKAHGGEIKVSTKENEGTAFIIQLPIH